MWLYGDGVELASRRKNRNRIVVDPLKRNWNLSVDLISNESCVRSWICAYLKSESISFVGVVDRQRLQCGPQSITPLRVRRHNTLAYPNLGRMLGPSVLPSSFLSWLRSTMLSRSSNESGKNNEGRRNLRYSVSARLYWADAQMLDADYRGYFQNLPRISSAYPSGLRLEDILQLLSTFSGAPHNMLAKQMPGIWLAVGCVLQYYIECGCSFSPAQIAFIDQDHS